MTIFGIGGKPFVVPHITATLQSSEAPMTPSVEASPQPKANLQVPTPTEQLNKNCKPPPSPDHVIYGVVSRITDYDVEVLTRPGPLTPTGSLKVDLSSAKKGLAAQWEDREGEIVVITGTIDKEGAMHASSIIHGQLYSSLWCPDF